MDISLEKLKDVKEIIFNNNITEKEKEEIINMINKKVEEILSTFEESIEPIDE